MGKIGMNELLIVLLIVLVIFGPKALPKLGRSLGKTLGSFKKGLNDDTPDDDEEVVVVKKKKTAKKAEAERKAAAAARYHTIRQGDTLGALARKYRTSVKTLCRLNGIKETTTLRLGKKLRVK